MSITRARTACGLALCIVSLFGVVAEQSDPVVDDAATDNSGIVALKDDVKSRIDAMLDNKMGEFGFEGCDFILGLADRSALVPHLVSVLRDENRDWLARQRSAVALVRSGDPRGGKATLQLIHEYLQPRKENLSLADCRVLDTCIYNLGRCGTTEAEDVAFQMLTSEYWADKPVPERRPTGEGPWTVQGFRRTALVALSYSGTDRAVKAFESGEEIPEDLWALYRGEMAGFAQSAREAREVRRQNQAATESH